MAISDLLIIGGAAWLIKEGLKKGSSNYDELDTLNYSNSDIDNQISELERRRKVNQKRKATPCYFKDGISAYEFERIALRVGKKIRRVKTVSVMGAVIYCTVESQTGYSNWDFNVVYAR